MMRCTLAGLMWCGVALSGCATTPSAPPIYTSMVLWPKGEKSACDFNRPQRDGAHALSYSSTPQSVSTMRRPAPFQSYAARNAQMQVRPVAGDRLCLVLRRGRTYGAADAVFGFEVSAVSPEEFTVTPKIARINRPALGNAGGHVEVRIGFASGSYQPEGSEMTSSARFELGAIPTDGQAVDFSSPAGTIRWPAATGQFDILRIGALIVEARLGSQVTIDDRELSATLSATP
ncbi:MAG: hypothetical protein KKC29_10750 [Alphaproteobacteria bacterium]|nr:hypothetical protein [Alphaproteobacteria bacterium]MBU2209583.1 hypothetical protein [Alphaproteobacteria bacterium]MBU2291564.1 hypothetical protein [Alphaproteobacteria bacterium]